MADGIRIRYISTDAERQTIPVVEYIDDKGKTTEFVSTFRPMRSRARNNCIRAITV